MLAPRRFLPSLPSLLALEAVDRLGSASAAAADLALTQSAISRQLRALQDQLGVELFRRKGKGIELTPGGAAYAQTARDCLQDLARASLKLRAAGERAVLNLAIKPAFGMHWLAPRLAVLSQRHPAIMINLSTRLAPFDLEREGIDAAIHFGSRDWQGMSYLPLAGERLTPCCRPDLMPQAHRDAAAILALPLLHLESRPGAWEEWFEWCGSPADRLRGLLFDQFHTLREAAVLGLGAALLPDYMAETEIAAGRLVACWPQPMETTGRYYLVWPERKAPSRPLALLIELLENSEAP